MPGHRVFDLSQSDIFQVLNQVQPANHPSLVERSPKTQVDDVDQTDLSRQNLWVITDGEQGGIPVLERLLPMPPIKPEPCPLPIAYMMPCPSLKQVLDFVQCFPKRRAPLARPLEQIIRIRVLSLQNFGPNGRVILIQLPDPF